MKKKRKKEQKISEKKKEKKIHSCRVGDTCPTCGKEDAIMCNREMLTAFGDGMAGGMHTFGPEAYLPLECRFCDTSFRKASGVSCLIRVLSVVPRILLGIRN